ncbi:MAG: radical SAM protein [Candidatus Portnoybacteria bacterium]|nr:radical SAM protein [Candidatus Portnoybacteria bacterium]
MNYEKLSYLEYPVFANIYLTNRCNLNCRHCIDSAGIISEQESKNELSNKEIYNIINYFLERGVENISFSGGEPLLHKNVFEFIAYLSKKNISVTLLSNIMLVDRKIAQKLKRSGLYYLRSSIEGPNTRLHDWIRGKGSFKKLLTNLKYLKEVDLPKLGVSLVVHKKNFDFVESVVRLLLRIGIYHLTLTHLIPSGRGKKMKDLVLDKQEYKSLLEMKPVLEKRYPKMIIYMDSPLEAIMCSEDKNKLLECAPCIVGRCFLGIKANGDIYACPMRDEVVIGNVRKDNLDDIWHNSTFLNLIRNTNLLKGKCKTCRLKDFCGGGCRALAHLHYNDVLMPDPYCWL